MLPIQEMDRINVKYAQVVIAYIIPDNIKWLFCWGKTGISEGGGALCILKGTPILTETEAHSDKG